MLKENSKVKVYLCNHQTFPEIRDEVKTRSSGVIFKVKKHNGRLGIDYNTRRSPYTCKGETFTPFETFASNVIFEDVGTGKQYHYSNITGSLEKI